MLNWFAKKEIWLYQPVVDFRKQLDGLVHIIENEMALRPADGSLYLFRNRTKDKLKLIVWDRNGFWLGYKRLETGRFSFPKDEAGQVSLSLEQLYLLISGLPLQSVTLLAETQTQYFS